MITPDISSSTKSARSKSICLLSESGNISSTFLAEATFSNATFLAYSIAPYLLNKSRAISISSCELLSSFKQLKP